MIKHLIGRMEQSLIALETTSMRELKFCESEILLADVSEYVERDMFPNPVQSEPTNSQDASKQEEFEFHYDIPKQLILPYAAEGPLASAAAEVEQPTAAKQEDKKPWTKPLEWKQPSWMCSKPQTVEAYIIETLKSYSSPVSLPLLKSELKKKDAPKEIMKQVSGPGNLYKLLKKIPGICETSFKSNPFFELAN